MSSPRLLLACLFAAFAFPLLLQEPAFGAEQIPYRPATGTTAPIVLKEVKPQYTQKAREAKIEGSVWLECVVTPKGVCSKIKILRSLDCKFGLDKEAIKAVRQWRFQPATKYGQPVPVRVEIGMDFQLPKRRQPTCRTRG